MNNHEYKQKQEEQECLKRVLLHTGNMDDREARIINLLRGEDVESFRGSKPDFLKRHLNASNVSQVIGIEHFRVDHYSEKKRSGRKVISSKMAHREEVEKFRRKWVDKIQDNEPVPDELIEGLCRHIETAYNNHAEATYGGFLQALQSTLRKHTEKVPDYRADISHYVDTDIEIVFLIEIHSDFSHLVLVDESGVRENKTGVMPLFRDVLSLLVEICSSKVDYIVLALHSYVNPKEISVRALAVDELKDMSYKYHDIYEYAGADCTLSGFMKLPSDFSKITGERSNDRIIFNLQRDISLKPYLNVESVIGALECVVRAARSGLNYATHPAIQWAFEEYRQDVASSSDGEAGEQ